MQGWSRSFDPKSEGFVAELLNELQALATSGAPNCPGRWAAARVGTPFFTLCKSRFLPRVGTSAMKVDACAPCCSALRCFRHVDAGACMLHLQMFPVCSCSHSLGAAAALAPAPDSSAHVCHGL